jgi:hypothetical protein
VWVADPVWTLGGRDKSYARAIREVTSGELLAKQAMRKKLLYIKNTYILKLLQNIVTAGTEAIAISKNTFLCAFVKEVCRL